MMFLRLCPKKLFDINFEQTGNQKMPVWTVFHAMISHNVYCPTNIGYYQAIAAPPTDFNTVYTVLKLADLREKFSRERNGQSVSLLNHLKQGLLPWNVSCNVFSIKVAVI